MNTTSFQALLCVDTKYSQRKVVAILMCCLRLRQGTLPQLHLLVESMKWVKEVEIAYDFEREIQICKPHFDEALAKHHQLLTSSGRTTEDWWSLVGEVASFAFDVEPFDTCVHHEGKWCDIGDTLSQVVAESLCGKQAFGW